MKGMMASIKNEPNMNYIMKVLCEQLSRQEIGSYEYSYKLERKENCLKNAEQA